MLSKEKIMYFMYLDKLNRHWERGECQNQILKNISENKTCFFRKLYSRGRLEKKNMYISGIPSVCKMLLYTETDAYNLN